MDLSKIITISGKSGLFKVIAQGKNAVIVESLLDKKRFPVYSSVKVITLEEISVFTTGEDKPLKEILLTIFDKENGQSISELKNDSAFLLSYFEGILPDYDKERVYVSDIKKILTWYNVLVRNQLIDKEEEKTETPEEQVSSGEEAETTEPADDLEKKTTQKKTKKKTE